MKKRLVSVLTVIALIVSMSFMMAGCGGGGSDSGSSAVSGDNTLTIWIHNDEDSWTKSYQEIADAYMEEHPDVTIKFESFPYDDFETKVQTALMSNEGGADIYELWGGWCVDFAPSGALAQLPEDMEKQIRDDAYPSTFGALEADGKLYAMPMEFNIECGGLIVNDNILKDNGLEVPKTWDEVVAAGKKATVEKDGQMEIKGFDFVNWDGVMYLYT